MFDKQREEVKSSLDSITGKIAELHPRLDKMETSMEEVRKQVDDFSPRFTQIETTLENHQEKLLIIEATCSRVLGAMGRYC